MRILHTSDWHLGRSERDKPLWDDQICFIDQICDLVRDENIDAVLVAGDVYDRPLVSAEAIAIYDDAMKRLCLELGSQVIVIAGNHDSAERLSSCSALLSKAGLHLAGKLGKDVSRVDIGDVEIYMLPWFTPEQARSAFPESAGGIKSLEDAYRVVCDSIRSDFRVGKKHILVAHAFVTDSEVSESDRAAVLGTADQVPASVFEDFDYVALGHIHKAQSISDRIRYSGTPMPYSFGREERQEKSVTIVDTDSMEQRIIPLKLLHRRLTLQGTMEEMEKADFPDDVRNGYVKIIVTDQYLGLEAMSILSGKYPNYLEMKGITYESDQAGIRMTLDEFRELESDPMEIFKSFCRETADMDPDRHLMELFRESLREEERE